MKQYLHPADLLLPKDRFASWAVIACDQYTSDKAYWEDVKKTVGKDPSTLHLVLPEIYLEETTQRVPEINATMQKYLEEDVFQTLPQSMVYIERAITGGKIRKGILGAVDLTEYDYAPGSTSLIRATEKTVLERIPPRVQIRKDAPLEFPHILLFIDDPTDSVIGAAAGKKSELPKLYDFELMKQGGHIAGYQLGEEIQAAVNEKLSALVKGGLLFAVGDGNHSLATAKECYNLSGTEKARYALVEVVNIHDPVIEFEPIYRVLFGTTTETVVNYLKEKNAKASGEAKHVYQVVDSNGESTLSLTADAKLPVGTLQMYLDDFLKENPEVSIDYIHGIDATRQLCQKENTVGFLFDGMEKNELFDAVIQDGSLPRKTFSMGHADDKRFYLEGRKIK